MWKKDDMPTNPYSPEPERTSRPDLSVSSSAPTPAPPAPAPVASSGQRATIGRSITIRGDVTGDEDLLIQGRVDGSIDLKQHAVTIGGEGEVKASIVGRVVIVEGSVEGNINSEEQVVLRSSARVKGDITSPRLVLEDGARFRGGVDMGDDADRGKSATSSQNQAKRPEAVSSSSPTSSTSATPEIAKATDSAKESDSSARSGESTSDANGASKRKGGSGAVAEATA